MKPILTTLRLWGFVVVLAAAQPGPKTGPACGFGLLQQYRQQQDPLLGQRMRQSEAQLQQRLRQMQGARVADVPYTIPVVVHVIHNGEAIGTPDNPSDAAIQAMLTGLNNAFQKNGSSFGGVAVNMQFQLAVRSPQCQSTTGIDRANGRGVPNYMSGGIAIGTYGGSADEVAVKALSRWPNTDYLNIWIVNKVNGSPYVGGFTYFPEFNAATNDGMVLVAGVVDGSPDAQ